MRRRDFFRTLGLFVGAASAPGIFLPKFEPVRWKVARPARCVLNPEYARAPYEILFLDQPPLFDKAIWDQDMELYGYLHERVVMESIFPPKYPPYPIRYVPRGDKLVEVKPFLEV